MQKLLSMCLEASLASVILIPLFMILNKRRFHDLSKTVCYLMFAVYLCGMYAVVGLPTINYVRFDPHYNLIPFAYMFSDFENSFLNVLLFIPLGFFLTFFWKHYKKFHRTLLFGFSVSLLIEFLQLFTYRATDINDLMTNTLGTFLGWGIAKSLFLLNPSSVPSWKTREVFWICGISFCVMFFLQPFLADIVFTFQI